MGSREKNFEGLADELLSAWQSAHGVESGKISALIGHGQVAFLIDGAFSKAERVLAEDRSGKSLLMEYTTELLAQISRNMKQRIESVAGYGILDSNGIANPDAGQVIFIYKFKSFDVAGTTLD